MGVIKDGSISGVLPSSSKAFAVHYPGYPSSTERAVETLGGNQGIAKARIGKSNKLELHFRPEDPYSHPTYGELQPCNSFLLKISRKKVKVDQNAKDLSKICEHVPCDSLHLEQNSSTPESTGTAECTVPPECQSSSQDVKAQLNTVASEQLSADIIARVPEAYCFNGMVDYQHVLAVHADVSRRKKRNWADIEPRLDKGSLLDVDQEDLMILVPPLFSLKDIPEKVVLKLAGDSQLKKKQVATFIQRTPLETEVEQCLAIDFNIKEIPKKVDWEKFIPRDSDRWKWQMAVCELFNEKPIWIKSSLTERLIDQGLNLEEKVLKRLLFLAAYYFSNGPFLKFWIRKGYDPRQDPESRIYQKTDFRVPPSLRSYSEANAESGPKSRWKDICAFKVFPEKTQTCLQLFDLKDDYIQQEIRKPACQPNCTLQTGWFSSHTLDSLRLRVHQKFLSVYPGNVEALLKSVTNRFEKSKKPHLHMKDQKVNREGKQADKEVLETEDKATHVEVEPYEEEEDDDDEMDDDGEDLDADEALDQVDHDGSFAMQPDLYMERDNISKDYLQNLFGSFPFGGTGGDETQGSSNPYDGEYEIYEQYSDDNYSDDEDY